MTSAKLRCRQLEWHWTAEFPHRTQTDLTPADMQHADADSDQPSNFSLMLGGPLYQFYLRGRLAKPPLVLLHRRIIALWAISWLPLFVLTLVAGTATGRVELPFLLDLGTQARLLVAIPLMLAGELLVHARLRATVVQFLERNLIAPDDLPRFESAIASAIRWRNSRSAELLVLVAAFGVGFWLWGERIALHIPAWYATPTDAGLRLTPAGWWHAVVSLGIFRLLLGRWGYRLFVWHRLLWQVSRIPLRINALHPDRAGGLGFVGQSVFAFVPVLLAATATLSGQIADQIRHEGAKLPAFKTEIVGVVVFLLAIVLVSQLFFLLPLSRAGRQGRREYGRLASEYVAAFREKWLAGNGGPRDEWLGSADIQSLADLAGSYEIASAMRPLPINGRIALRLVILTVLPLVPLLLTMIPVDEMLDRLIKIFL